MNIDSVNFLVVTVGYSAVVKPAETEPAAIAMAKSETAADGRERLVCAVLAHVDVKPREVVVVKRNWSQP